MGLTCEGLWPISSYKWPVTWEWHTKPTGLKKETLYQLIVDNLWSCTLNSETKEFSWNPEDPSDTKEDGDSDLSVKPGHRLLIKTAVLMPFSKKDEVTIVQIEGRGYNKSNVVVRICAMKGGVGCSAVLGPVGSLPLQVELAPGRGTHPLGRQSLHQLLRVQGYWSWR